MVYLLNRSVAPLSEAQARLRRARAVVQVLTHYHHTPFSIIGSTGVGS